jgi:hypothetical protein
MEVLNIQKHNNCTTSIHSFLSWSCYMYSGCVERCNGNSTGKSWGSVCWGRCLFCIFTYIRANAVSRWIPRRMCIRFVQISGKSVMETLAWLGSVRGRKHEPYTGVWKEQSKLTEIEKGETREEQSQEHAHNFLWCQGDCSHRISPDGPNSQFRVLL